jgi:hypothetical protein
MFLEEAACPVVDVRNVIFTETVIVRRVGLVEFLDDPVDVLEQPFVGEHAKRRLTQISIDELFVSSRGVELRGFPRWNVPVRCFEIGAKFFHIDAGLVAHKIHDFAI